MVSRSMICLISAVLLLLLIPTSDLAAKRLPPNMEVDERGGIGVTLMLYRAGWAKPLMFERLREPIGEFAESSKLAMMEWETAHYLAKYDRKIEPSAKSHCAGHVTRYLSTFWRKDPQGALFPYTKMDTDVLVDIFRALDLQKLDKENPPEVGDVIFWADKEIKDQGDRKPGKNRGTMHFSYVKEILPNGDIRIESKDSDQSTFHVDMPADPNDLMRGWGPATWTDDTLLNTYSEAHRYRPLALSDLVVTWRYWIPKSTDLAGYWVDQADPKKVYRVYQPRPEFAEHKLPMQILETFGGERQLRAGFQDDTYFFAQEFGADETAKPKRMAKFAKDKIEWLGPAPKSGSGKSYRDVISTWVRIEPYLALRTVERTVESYHSESCGAVGKDKLDLGTSSGSFDMCFWAHWENKTKYKKYEGSIFYDFPAGLPFEKEGYSNKVLIPIRVGITKANFTAVGSMDAEHYASIGLYASEQWEGSISQTLADGIAKSLPTKAGNYLTTVDPIEISCTREIKGAEVGDSVVIIVTAESDRTASYGPTIKCFLRAVWDVVPGESAAPILSTGGKAVDPFSGESPPPPRTGRDPYKYGEATILNVKNPKSIMVRLSPNSTPFPLDANTKTLPEYAEISLAWNSELTLAIEDPRQPGRKVRVTFKPFTHGKINELWPNAKQDRAGVSFDRGVLDVDANGLGNAGFRVSSPTTTMDVTGTRFRAEHDPESGTTRVAVEEGAVLTTPTNNALAPVTVSTGQQVDVTPAAVGPVQASTGEPLVSAETSDDSPDERPLVPGDTSGDSPDGLPEDYPEDWRSQLPPDAQIAGMEDDDEFSGGEWPAGEIPSDDGEWLEVDDDGVTVIGMPVGENSEDFSDDYPDDFMLGSLDEIIAQLRDPDPEMRFDAGLAIAEMGEDAADAIPVLLELLRESDSMTRMAGLIGLMGIGPVGEAIDALPNILPLIQDSDSMVRSEAALYLGDLGSAAPARQKQIVRGALRQALNDPSQQVRDSAEGALELMED